MRTSLMIALLLLVLTIVGGTMAQMQTGALSDRYVSAAEELRILAQKEEWPRAAEIVSAYRDDWRRTTSWLQMLINHEDIDDVTLALARLQAAIDAKEQGSCYEACAELRENARHIYHRDAFTPGNVL